MTSVLFIVMQNTRSLLKSAAAMMPLLVLWVHGNEMAYAQQWASNGTNIYNTNSGNVGIGTTTPGASLAVAGKRFVVGSANLMGAYSGGDAGMEIQAGGGGATLGFTQASGVGPFMSLGVFGNNGHISVDRVGGAAYGDFIAYTGAAERLRITSAGRVGIGTASPITTLHVVGDVTVTGNIAAKNQDIAEWVRASSLIQPSTVVVLDPTHSNSVMPASEAYDTRVAGVVSSSPGIVLGEAVEGMVKVATTGRVKVRVDATNAPIHIGDLLVTSPKKGMAMRSEPVTVAGIQIHRPGTIIGKALEALDEGEGQILVLLSLQ